MFILFSPSRLKKVVKMSQEKAAIEEAKRNADELAYKNAQMLENTVVETETRPLEVEGFLLLSLIFIENRGHFYSET